MAEIDKATTQTKNKIKAVPTNVKVKSNPSTITNKRSTSYGTTTVASKQNVKTSAVKPKPTVVNTGTKAQISTSVVKNQKASVTTKPTTSKRLVTESKTVAANRQIVSSKATKANVINTRQNVTVTTPPMQRKAEANEAKTSITNTVTKTEQKKKVLRTGSRTLEPNEILILKRESDKREESQHDYKQQLKEKSPIRPAIAFEVNLNDAPNKPKEIVKCFSDTEYSDDCESSFSSRSTIASSSSETEDKEISLEHGDDYHSHTSDENQTHSAEEQSEALETEKQLYDDDDESQITPYASTIIFKERKLDSGNYEINSQKHHLRASEFDHSSLGGISATRSENLDSGISNYSNCSASTKQLGHHNSCFSGYVEFANKPVINSRGRNLLAKLGKFDEVSFVIFELKPINYEIYMLHYNNFNTTQSYAQTGEDNRMSGECQTDDYTERNMWTQHPPIFDHRTGMNISCDICESIPEPNSRQDKPFLLPRVKNARSRRNSKHMWASRKPISYENLNTFLLRSSLILSRIIDVAKPLPQSYVNSDAANLSCIKRQSHHQLNTQVLNALHVVRVFANVRHNTIITVHDTLPDVEVYRADFSNLLMVWSSDGHSESKPIRLLSTWSEVSRADICYDCADIVVCGLRDGSIALWNLQESHSYCSKLDGYLTHFSATHSIVPKHTLTDNSTDEQKLLDIGATVDVKSFRSPASSTPILSGQIANKHIQFISLHDNGLLTIWTLVTNNANCDQIAPQSGCHQKSNSKSNLTSVKARFEFSSPWAQMKLIQSNTFDLRNYLDKHDALNCKTHFERTREMFVQDICSDNARSQLAQTTAEMLSISTATMNLRFTALDVGEECIYVCTNRNFVISCTRTLKSERIKRIIIDESRSVFLTALRVLANENIIAVGLANGAVIIVNCSRLETAEQDYSDTNGKSKHTHSAEILDPNDAIENKDLYTETAKSCAIQNIILNEKHIPAQNPQTDNHLTRLTTAHVNSVKYNKRKAPLSFERRICDQLLLLSGSDLRENLVQSLEVTNNGEHLFVLSKNRLREYDFTLDTEITCDLHAICDVTMTRDGLVMLNTQNSVDIYKVK